MKKPALFLSAVLLLLSLAACDSVPKFSKKSDPTVYQPLSADLAAMRPRGINTTQTLYCMAGKGQIRLPSGWRPMMTVNFTLAENARTNMTLRPTSGAGSAGLQGIFDHEGQKLVFCPLISGPANKQVSCGSLYALDDDLAMGIRRTFDVPDAVMGAEITCAFSQGAMQKL